MKKLKLCREARGLLHKPFLVCVGTGAGRKHVYGDCHLHSGLSESLSFIVMIQSFNLVPKMTP